VNDIAFNPRKKTKNSCIKRAFREALGLKIEERPIESKMMS